MEKKGVENKLVIKSRNTCKYIFFLVIWIEVNDFLQKMLEELEERVKLGELTSEELPTIKTIEGWISRFAASHKKSMAQKILEENQNKNQ
jgi:hypothetical protein